MCSATLSAAPTASANSSRRWISDVRPYDVLHFIAIITIAIETAVLWRALGKQHLTKGTAIVV